jgi:hypothetical protein
MNYFKSQSLFDDKVTELRTADGNLIGLIEQVSPSHFKATNYLKLKSQAYSIEDATNFILRSFNGKPSSQTKISRNQIQLNF